MIQNPPHRHFLLVLQMFYMADIIRQPRILLCDPMHRYISLPADSKIKVRLFEPGKRLGKNGDAGLIYVDLLESLLVFQDPFSRWMKYTNPFWKAMREFTWLTPRWTSISPTITLSTRTLGSSSYSINTIRSTCSATPSTKVWVIAAIRGVKDSLIPYIIFTSVPGEVLSEAVALPAYLPITVRVAVGLANAEVKDYWPQWKAQIDEIVHTFKAKTFHLPDGELLT